MCNEAGEISRLSFCTQSLFELNKELIETEENIRHLERNRTEARMNKEVERLAGIEDWLEALRDKAIRLRSEVQALEQQERSKVQR